MSWRLATSLDVLRKQVDRKWPKRNKSSDGTIGDAAHASRASDHNPWVQDGAYGVVTAIDFTHDPKNGPDAGKLAESLRQSRDPRIKYLISNRRICSSTAVGGVPAWTWRPYSGSNPHDKHCHLSVKSEKKHYDSVSPWLAVAPADAAKLPKAEKPKPAPAPQSEPAAVPPPPDVEPIPEKPPRAWYRKPLNWLKGLGIGGLGIGGVTLDASTILAVCVLVVVLGVCFLIYWKFIRGKK